ncbi:hypothetical protein P154DRAFT_539735 [Amniculicola lignicola CBS 123094]|uniref:Uncharacterized protein n=1 Tax=Amniculicola lignicola CBS 123094 TaxID=1392246 RepID=A0A6A5VY14_9PLEO|nr:hypothetical protein P154DRAFT_539735 [Amniculicola lignicola CBS 123094]
MCVEDYTTLGKSLDPSSKGSYSYIPHLHNLPKYRYIYNVGKYGGPKGQSSTSSYELRMGYQEVIPIPAMGGLDLLIPAAPVWNTDNHTDIQMKLHLGIQWTQREGGRDGCNKYQNSDHINEHIYIEQFLAALNRCNKEGIEKKYRQYPIAWNSLGSCIDFWLVGHGDDWTCDGLGGQSKECMGR